MNGPLLVSAMISIWMICYLIVEYFKGQQAGAEDDKASNDDSDSDESIEIPEDLE